MINDINKISDTIWEIPRTHKDGMNVPARIIATENILNQMDDGVFDQLTNVASLPEIQKYALCMPDGHWGYGFPIGGVAAFDLENGIISPGGIGFDINCGVRAISTNLTYDDIKPKLKEIVDVFFSSIPTGIGTKGYVKLNKSEFNELLTVGTKWAVENGYGWDEDIEKTENNGRIKQANVENVSDKAIKRGISQVGTLGSGNHYAEIQTVDKIFDDDIARAFGINQKNQIVIMIHCGSRGFGHQVGTDYLRLFDSVMKKYNINVKDRELAAAPFQSEEGQNYYNAMACAANMAFVNRQVIMHRVREAFSKVFKQSAEDMEIKLIYDVAHNIAKIEKYNGKKLIVHRKGATRSFGPGNSELPNIYRKTGQPVIIGGSMETGSYLLVGTKKAEEETFGSTAHGSGRTMSRSQAKKKVRGDELQKKMLKRGIYVKTSSFSGLAEEAGIAYKNISDVIESVDTAGISKKVVSLKPIGNIKG